MATTFSGLNIHQIPAVFPIFQRPVFSEFRRTAAAIKPTTPRNFAVRSRLVEHGAAEGIGEAFNLDELVDFLNEDLPHLFDDQGIDRSMYEDRVRFRDPITRHDTIDGYLFNIRLLRFLFSPEFYLHRVWKTGPHEITTRWTMVMKFVLLPWKPKLVFTGMSIMGINCRTGKFCSHVDLWDSIQNNEYFSLEGLLDVVRQLRIYITPDLETPDFLILKRTAKFEVRRYASFIVAETKGDELSGSSGFREVAGYIFGKNSTMETFPMTTPVFTVANDTELSEVSIQIVLPKEKELSKHRNI
ncbi:hypothetical protein HPP92_002436 [Vanilla planifolia]|uniref:SOUL heme-binding protein n=1 Tax=Vanilla planifolia TaxID=51239 RepID=A0A835S6D4_VANPL|nr:hypothetical protein HPP92_002436 [Vanilla planifolia]